jgi:hypothetical protein
MNNCCDNPIALSCRFDCGCYEIPLNLTDGDYTIYNRTTGKKTTVTIGEGQGLLIPENFFAPGQNIIQIFDSLGVAVEMDFTDVLGHQQTANAFIISSTMFYTVDNCAPDPCDICEEGTNGAVLVTPAVLNLMGYQSFAVTFALNSCCEGIRFAGFEDAVYPYTCQKLSDTQFLFTRKSNGDDPLSFYAKFATTNANGCNFTYSVLINILP